MRFCSSFNSLNCSIPAVGIQSIHNVRFVRLHHLRGISLNDDSDTRPKWTSLSVAWIAIKLYESCPSDSIKFETDHVISFYKVYARSLLTLNPLDSLIVRELSWVEHYCCRWWCWWWWRFFCCSVRLFIRSAFLFIGLLHFFPLSLYKCSYVRSVNTQKSKHWIAFTISSFASISVSISFVLPISHWKSVVIIVCIWYYSSGFLIGFFFIFSHSFFFVSGTKPFCTVSVVIFRFASCPLFHQIL